MKTTEEIREIPEDVKAFFLRGEDFGFTIFLDDIELGEISKSGIKFKEPTGRSFYFSIQDLQYLIQTYKEYFLDL